MKISIAVAPSGAATTRKSFWPVRIRDIVGSLRDWLRMRRAERELYALDDRYRRDMGISRSEIPNAVRGLVRSVASPLCKPRL